MQYYLADTHFRTEEIKKTPMIFDRFETNIALSSYENSQPARKMASHQ